MTVLLDGVSLRLDQVISVARQGARVVLAPEAIDRMRRSRQVLEQAGAEGMPIYGFSTGAGALKRVAVDAQDVHEFNRLLVMNCRVGQGPPASDDVVRGTLLRLANNLARATTGVRPELAELVVQGLNEHWPIAIRTLGSVGQADLAPMGDVAAALIERVGLRLEAGEGMAMVDNNSLTDVSCPVPMLHTRPPPRVAARTKASTTSSTKTKSRVCSPSPKTVMGSPRRSRSAKMATTPASPCGSCRGP